MSADGRVFLRVADVVLQACKRIAKARGQRPGSTARDLITAGHEDGQVPALIPPPHRNPLNVSLPLEMREQLERAAQVEAERIGQSVDLGAYARRCLHRGIELAEQGVRTTVRRRSSRRAA